MNDKLTRRATLAGAAALTLTGCGSAPTVIRYGGPEITRIGVFKQQRRMYLIHNTQVVRAYDVDLGWSPTGDKKIEGDGKTPEGHYLINRRNPRSQFHLSLGIDYPRRADWAEARALGRHPGGDIFIHGHGRKKRPAGTDWTWGCIAVPNDEMEEIYSMVRTGTQISIYA